MLINYYYLIQDSITMQLHSITICAGNKDNATPRRYANDSLNYPRLPACFHPHHVIYTVECRL